MNNMNFQGFKGYLLEFLIFSKQILNKTHNYTTSITIRINYYIHFSIHIDFYRSKFKRKHSHNSIVSNFLLNYIDIHNIKI